MINEIKAAAPKELRPLSMYEIVDLVRRRLPRASEKMVRECFREREPKPKRGPKGPHKSDRQARLQELSDRLLAPQL
jgi:hypothetical protein